MADVFLSDMASNWHIDFGWVDWFVAYRIYCEKHAYEVKVHLVWQWKLLMTQMGNVESHFSNFDCPEDIRIDDPNIHCFCYFVNDFKTSVPV